MLCDVDDYSIEVLSLLECLQPAYEICESVNLVLLDTNDEDSSDEAVLFVGQ